MDSLYYTGIENRSETDDKLSFLQRSATTTTRVCEKPSTSSMDALHKSGEQNWSPEKPPLSTPFFEGNEMLHGPPSNSSPASKSALTPALHGRSNFVPMDPRSLGASIKREENWSQRRRSPSRKPSHLRIKFSTCKQSTTADDVKVNKPFSQSDDLSFSGDFDEVGTSDDEESKSFLLGVSTPTTLRRRKLQLSLHPVHESCDEVAGENRSNDPENN